MTLGPARGAALTVLASVAFALSSVFARLAYDAGSNPVTVGATRMLVSSAAVAVVLALSREPFRLSGRLAAAPPLLGLLLAGYSWALLSAVERMPVASAVLAFYVFPLLIVAAAAIEGRERVGLRRSAAMATAFAGLAVALGGSASGFDGLGLAYALAAAAGNAAMIVATRDVEARERRRLTMWLLLCAGLVLLAAGAVGSALRFPTTPGGLLALAAASGCYAVAMTSMFVAIGLIGPVQVGALFNVEPVASLLIALALLGEVPTVAQVAGMALVVGALLAVQLMPDEPRPRRGQPRE